MLHKCIMVKMGEKRERKLRKKPKFNENRGKDSYSLFCANMGN